MGKRAVPLHPFVGGLAPGADPREPLGVAADGSGFDPMARPGRLMGHKGATSLGLTARPSPVVALTGDGGQVVVVAHHAATSVAVRDASGYTEYTIAPPVSAAAAYGDPLSGSLFAETFRVGTSTQESLFVKQEGAAAGAMCAAYLVQASPTNLYLVPRVTTTGASTPTTGGDDNFESGVVEYWASFVYDGYQEGPLSPAYTGATVDRTATPVESLATTFEVLVGEAHVDALALSRITALNVYRTTKVESLRSAPTLVATKLISDMTLSGAGLTEKRSYTLNDTGLFGPSFLSNAGYSETLETVQVGYKLSAAVGAFHVVGDVVVYANVTGHDGDLFEGTGRNFVMVSAPYQPDVIDWTTRWVRLPERPRTIVPFRDLAFCFGETACYVVDPIGVSLEDTLAGFSAAGPRAAAANDRGVLAVGSDGVPRFFDGSGVVDVADRLTRDYLEGTFDLADAHVATDARQGQFVAFAPEDGTGDTGALVLRADRKAPEGFVYSRVLAGSFGTIDAVARGLDGTLWVWSSEGVHSAFAGARSAWSWSSRPIDPAQVGTPGDLVTDRVDVVFREGPGEEPPAVWVGDGATATSLSLSRTDGLVCQFDVPEPQRGLRPVVVRVDGAAGSILDAVDLVIRPVGPHVTR